MDIKQPAPIIISHTTDPLLVGGALEFINAIALSRHNAIPPPPPEILFTATDAGRVVGTIALDFANSERPLPLEQIYSFPTPPFSENSPRTAVAQYGRWMSTVP